jgi:hypothetical protein
MQVILFIALLMLCHTQIDYHSRMVYLYDYDNVCYYGAHYDSIDISIEVDGVNTKRVLAYGGTFCRQWVQG